MSDIPQELIDEARLIAGAAAGQVSDNTDAAAVETLVTRLVATALMARDQRAANIATVHIGHSDDAAERIATTILTYGASNDQ